MKKRYFVSLLAVVCLVSTITMVSIHIINIKAGENPPFARSMPVYANVPKGTIIYDSIGGEAVDIVPSGEKVEILKDRSTNWYYIRYKNKLGWVKADGIEIPKDLPTDTSILPEEVIIDFANKRLKSNTEHYIIVDINRQRVYVLKSEANKTSSTNWILEKNLVCATGVNKSPTTRGKFTIGDRGEWFYSDRLGSGAKYWVRFNESYLFHSVAMDKYRNVIDDTLGKKCSSGCVRLSVEDAKWFFENVEKGSGVFVY